MIDYKKLEAGLNKLTGFDLLTLEQEERMAGNKTLELSTSKSFQARLAAKALDMNVHDLYQLPLKEFNTVCVYVFGFLNEPAEATT
ncbi:MAG: hypothetical protein IKD73_09405 [Selenomonadaceae bacterium]|nr:hypothetical protein [Selenomonadaceae bacterium]